MTCCWLPAPPSSIRHGGPRSTAAPAAPPNRRGNFRAASRALRRSGSGAGAPDGRAARCEIAIEQHLAVERMNAHGRAQRLVAAVDRSERKARLAVAEDDRRDHDM